MSKPQSGHPARTIEHEYTRNLPALLQHLNGSLLATTYQAGKLVVAGSHGSGLLLSFHNVERAMGLAVGRDGLVVGSQRQIWQLPAAPGLAAQLDGRPDGCFLARSSHVTGDIQGHELAWGGGELWLVNTLFSCLCTLDRQHSFVPRWRPRFISALAAEDRCHLNGLAVSEAGDRPQYVTALAETDRAGGWRDHKADGGVLIDVASRETVARGFAMPHSPRLHHGRLFVLDSGRGLLTVVDPENGKIEPLIELPGYPRGLALVDNVAFVGLSKIRETATFTDIPLAAKRARLRCGVALVELNSCRQVAWLQFHSGVEEIFEVGFLPGIQRPVVCGPYPDVDGQQTLWLAPAAGAGA